MKITGGDSSERYGIDVGETSTRPVIVADVAASFNVTELLDYRPAADDQSRRSAADVPLAELACVVVSNPDLLDEPDPARGVARLLGVERLAAVSRARLDEAIARARQHIPSTQPSG